MPELDEPIPGTSTVRPKRRRRIFTPQEDAVARRTRAVARGLDNSPIPSTSSAVPNTLALPPTEGDSETNGKAKCIYIIKMIFLVFGQYIFRFFIAFFAISSFFHYFSQFLSSFPLFSA